MRHLKLSTVKIALPLLLLAIGAWAGARELRSSDSWLQVERRDLVLGVEVEGELRAVNSVELGPPQIDTIWNFKISSLVPEGTEVEAGDPVLGFDTSQLVQALQDETATRDAAQKELEKTETDLEVMRRDLEMRLAEARARLKHAELDASEPPEVTSRLELEEARIDQRLAELEIGHLRNNLEHLAVRTRADLAALRAKRDRAAARVEEIEHQLDQMQVVAPRAGTVIYSSNRRGEKRKIGDTVWRAVRVVEIPDLREMYAEGEIDEADAGRVEVGQPITLRLDAYLDKTYRGRVRSLRRTVQQKSDNIPKKVVKLEIELDDTDVERMRPGMRFRGSIETERIEDVLSVPLAAIHTDAEGSSVFSRRWGRKERIYPEFGRRNAEVIEVVAGLSEGDRVLRLDALDEEAGS